MRYMLLFIASISLSTLLAATPAFAQNAPAADEITATTTVATEPVATTSPIVASSTPTTPAKKSKPKTVTLKTPMAATTTSTSTASTTVFLPPALTTAISGNIYTYETKLPLSNETTQGVLGLAALAALVGLLMIQKNFLERSVIRTLTFFSSRSLPQPQAKRQ